MSESPESLCNFINLKTRTYVFPCEFCEVFQNITFIEHFRVPAFIPGT